jgi:hypothetical protein
MAPSRTHIIHVSSTCARRPSLDAVARAQSEIGLHSLVLYALIKFRESAGAHPNVNIDSEISVARFDAVIATSLQSLRSLVSRAPDIHAFQQVDVAQAPMVANWRALLHSGQIVPTPSASRRLRERGGWDPALYLHGRGTSNKIVVEISSQDGHICMASNLIIHHRWCGFLFDDDPSFVSGFSAAIRRCDRFRQHSRLADSIGTTSTHCWPTSTFPRRSTCCLSIWMGMISTFGMP